MQSQKATNVQNGKRGGSLGLSNALSGTEDQNVPSSIMRQIPPK